MLIPKRCFPVISLVVVVVVVVVEVTVAVLTRTPSISDQSSPRLKLAGLSKSIHWYNNIK